MLLEGSVEPTLSLDEFVTGEKIASRASPCPHNNSGLVIALKNFQITMQIVFSESFETCLDGFIDNLEGAVRPLELVNADFLRHSVELTLRMVFRTIRMVRIGSLAEGISVKDPHQCAAFLTTSFDQLAEELADHHIMARQDGHF
jgi:hypothetical protein